MTSISPFGNRYNTQLTGSGQQPARADTDKRAAPVKVPDSGNVALSSSGLDLQQRVAGLGNATIDLAQNLLGNFAGKLFGDAMKGATIDFDSVSLESTSTFAAGAMHAEGANGVADAAAFSLTDSAHFLGKGTITLADGQKYDFEVEVQYEASLTAGAATRSEKAPDDKRAAALPMVEFPEIDWAGGLSDLFKLMDKHISANIKRNDTQDTLGTLSARLFKLVNSEKSADTYAPPTATQVKNAASAYGAGAPVKDGPVRAAGPDPVVDTQTTADAKGPMRAPAPDPVVDTQTQPVKSGGDIPLTISTTPPAGDAA
ncbi:hypothetical protein ACFFTM_11785 [Pseudoduganella plicata]|uniref:AsmA-like C-terminal domain-containing protein n=1 Tax=Pseudoduganella plicata TaxID=321984 RepID=A0A4P7BBP5_9BURK|nr:hypothetical protein [Pseudoduganella plicata]QBQ35894.1 hypothetical protein E1742_06795 [Pseudoduganella plicata]GGY94253.1 hypothetical protein GCM10007388_29310 [Pseudoduganella plicata]